jgi:hypothetical protein
MRLHFHYSIKQINEKTRLRGFFLYIQDYEILDTLTAFGPFGLSATSN